MNVRRRSPLKMQTLEDYIQLLESPMSVDVEWVESLQSMLEYAPYCASARLLLLRALFLNRNKEEWTNELQRSLLYAPLDVSVYFLLRSAMADIGIKGNEQRDKVQSIKSNDDNKTMSYFDLLDKMALTAKKTGISFEELTKRYIETSKYIG